MSRFQPLLFNPEQLMARTKPKTTPLTPRQMAGKRFQRLADDAIRRAHKPPPPIPVAVRAPQPFAVIEIAGGNVQAEHEFGCKVHVIDWDNAKGGDLIVGNMIPAELLRRLPPATRKEIAERDAMSKKDAAQ